MSTGGQIHWHEGLFLQPHHLQANQREGLARAAAERRACFAYPYGVVSSDLSRDGLENRLVRFNGLRAVMPSGTVVVVSDTAEDSNTDLPPLDFSKVTIPAGESVLVRIGVPLLYPGRANAVEAGAAADAHRSTRRYKVAEADVPDENTGRNPQPVQFRRLNARLLLEHDDDTDLEVLPLVRVRSGAAGDAGLPRRDDEYFPPCLVMDGWPPLRGLMAELVEQIEASRAATAHEITRDGFDLEAMRPAQMRQLFRLQALNRAAPRLREYTRAAGVPPVEVYLALRELLGDLAACAPDDDQYDVPDYDHDNCALAFLELDRRIRAFLGEQVKGRVVAIPLAPEPRMRAAVAIAPEHLGLTQYFLAVESRDDPSTVSALVQDPDKFKFMPRSKIRVAVRGVRLTFDHHPPSQLPSGTGVSYFRLDRNDPDSKRMWDLIQAERALAVTYAAVDTSDYKVTLYGMLPAQ